MLRALGDSLPVRDNGGYFNDATNSPGTINAFLLFFRRLSFVFFSRFSFFYYDSLSYLEFHRYKFYYTRPNGSQTWSLFRWHYRPWELSIVTRSPTYGDLGLFDDTTLIENAPSGSREPFFSLRATQEVATRGLRRTFYTLCKLRSPENCADLESLV